jgi:hypothetical protein
LLIEEGTCSCAGWWPVACFDAYAASFQAVELSERIAETVIREVRGRPASRSR